MNEEIIVTLDTLPPIDLTIETALQVNVTPDTEEVTTVQLNVGLPGPQGPQGLPGSAGKYAVETTDSTIPADQYFTVVNASVPTTQTLPLISAIFSALGSGLSAVFTVANVTANEVSIVASGGDSILVGSPVNEPFINSSFSFLATPLGWVII